MTTGMIGLWGQLPIEAVTIDVEMAYLCAKALFHCTSFGHCSLHRMGIVCKENLGSECLLHGSLVPSASHFGCQEPKAIHGGNGGNGSGRAGGQSYVGLLNQGSVFDESRHSSCCCHLNDSI